MYNCPKLPRCSDKDREGFTGFAIRELTDPNRKASAKWKGNASEPRCIFSETIQSVITSTFPGCQYRRPQKQVHGRRVWRSPICELSRLRHWGAFKARSNNSDVTGLKEVPFCFFFLMGGVTFKSGNTCCILLLKWSSRENKSCWSGRGRCVLLMVHWVANTDFQNILCIQSL